MRELLSRIKQGRRTLWSFVLRKKRLFVLGAGVSGFFGVLVPVMLLTGNHAVDFLDSTAFCTDTCHAVHYAEAVTFSESPHKEVSCSSCHIGEGTANLIRAKLIGLTDIIPAITGDYEKPFPVPLKHRRPSDETCEKCHWSEKFMGDIPQIRESFASDQANTKTTVTHVLKVGGGKPEVAGGIHWHATANIWYLPVDDQYRQIAWVSSENVSGAVTEYIDPNLMQGVTPERIQEEKRLMDCMDCHNRATHLFRSPDELLNIALSDGSIDSSLPFIKREALNALVPQNASLDAAYAKVDRIADFYRTSYPKVVTEQKPALERALEKLKEIARLTTFEKGLDWNTYADNAKHDKPDENMQIDWDTLAAQDASPGCFRCHGNLVKLGADGKPVPDLKPSPTSHSSSFSSSATPPLGGPATNNVTAEAKGGVSNNVTVSRPNSPGSGKLNADCDSCHFTFASESEIPVAPAISHPIDGLDDCLVCHGPSAPEAFEPDHPWSTNEACGSCHKAAPKLKALPTARPPEDAGTIAHPIKKLEDCSVCHSPNGGSPLKREHPWATDDTCISCHEESLTPKPLPSPKPVDAKPISHPTEKLEDCLLCHAPAAEVPMKADHPWSTNETCRTCHVQSSTPMGMAKTSSAIASPVNHSTAGLGNCSSCHGTSGPATLPPDHAGRPDSFCTICHKPAGTAPAIAVVATPAARPISHPVAGLSNCSSCHKASGPASFQPDHAGRPDSMCTICHKPGAAAPPSGTGGALAASPITHSTTGLGSCSSCHKASGPAPFQPDHAGRPDSMCTICHKPGTAQAPAPANATILPAGNSAASSSLPASSPAAAMDAGAVYSSNCAMCHGADRSGGPVGRPLTATALNPRTESWLVSFISNHNTGAAISPAERTALAQWLKGSTPTAASPGPSPTSTPAPSSTPAPASTGTPTPQFVSYTGEVQPLLSQNCSCHITGSNSPRLNTYANVVARVTPGNASSNRLINGMGANYLTADQAQVIINWISQGALNTPVQGPLPAPTTTPPTAPAPPPAPPAASIPHATAGYTDCVTCHASNSFRPFPQTHAGRTSSSCTACHQSSGTGAPRLSVGAPTIDHSVTNRSDCRSCHGRSESLPGNHSSYQSPTCQVCHRT